MDLKSKIVLIYGPTASGKSYFAIKKKKKIKTANNLNKIVRDVLNTSQKTILLVIYNSQNQRRYIGVKLK